MPPSPFPLLFADTSGAEPDDLPHAWMRHLESLYTLAQVLTLDADQAARLVEDTYLAAVDASAVPGAPAIDRPWLFGTMRSLHAGRTVEPTPEPSLDPDERPRLFASQHNLKQRLVEPFLRSAAPVALASLEERDRILLTLCESERLSCVDAARILGEEGDAVCRQLELARAAFRYAVTAQATPMIRDLLHAFNPEEWVPATLRRAIKAEFGSLPPSLEPSIKAALNAPPIQQALDNEAADRKASLPKPFAPRLKRLLAPAALIVVAGLVGYLGTDVLVKPPDPNVIHLAVRHADRVAVEDATEAPEEAERYLRDRLNWRLKVPQIADAALVGAGVMELASGVNVPTLLYADAGADEPQPLVVYAFTYALLDRHADRVFMERDILSAIAEQGHFDLYTMSDQRNVVVWRDADDIFVAVTRSDPGVLKDRIQAP